MPIRIKPVVGQKMTINNSWFNDNEYISYYIGDLKANVVYEIMEVKELDDKWGISKIVDVETLEVFDISQPPELVDFWCLFDADDSIRILE